MYNVIAAIMVALGVGLLIGSLPAARRLVFELPEGRMRRQWTLLTATVLLGVLGNTAYLVAWWGSHLSFPDLLVPLLFFASAAFAYLSTRLSLTTVVAIRRLSTLERKDLTEALTGMHSRQYLDGRMREELVRADRHGLAVSVLLLDLDDFNSINKDYGHAVGDKILTEVGRILSGSLRESDVLVRYSGEEMAVLATHTPPEAARGLAERLRHDIEVGARKALREAQGAKRAITVSIGVAGRPAGKSAARAPEEIFNLAEEALEQAKKAGGNRVATARA
jgi:two-component system cell cycle response regulator